MVSASKGLKMQIRHLKTMGWPAKDFCEKNEQKRKWKRDMAIWE